MLVLIKIIRLKILTLDENHVMIIVMSSIIVGKNKKILRLG